MATSVGKLSPEALFGREIARLRMKLGISQEELAFRAEVHRTYISQLERGVEVTNPHRDPKAVSCFESISEQVGGNSREATVAVA